MSRNNRASPSGGAGEDERSSVMSSISGWDTRSQGGPAAGGLDSKSDAATKVVAALTAPAQPNNLTRNPMFEGSEGGSSSIGRAPPPSSTDGVSLPGSIRSTDGVRLLPDSPGSRADIDAAAGEELLRLAEFNDGEDIEASSVADSIAAASLRSLEPPGRHLAAQTQSSQQQRRPFDSASDGGIPAADDSDRRAKRSSTSILSALLRAVGQMETRLSSRLDGVDKEVRALRSAQHTQQQRRSPAAQPNSADQPETLPAPTPVTSAAGGATIAAALSGGMPPISEGVDEKSAPEEPREGKQEQGPGDVPQGSAAEPMTKVRANFRPTVGPRPVPMRFTQADRRKSTLDAMLSGGGADRPPPITEVQITRLHQGDHIDCLTKEEIGFLYETWARNATLVPSMAPTSGRGPGRFAPPVYSITVEDLKRMLEDIYGFVLPEGQVQEMMDLIDASGTGSIDFGEFLTFIRDVRSGKFEYSPTLSKLTRNFNPVKISTAQLERRMELMKDIVTENIQKTRDETRKVEGSSRGVLSPLSTLHICWDLFICFLLIITVILTPLVLAFARVSHDLFGLSLFIDLMFCIDIIKAFNTGFQTQDGLVVMDRRRLSIAYLKTWFLPDLASAVPWGAIFPDDPTEIEAGQISSTSIVTSATSTTRTLKLLRIVRIAKILRLFRVSRTFKYLARGYQYLEEKYHFRVSRGFIRLTGLCTVLFLVAHWMGCLFWMIVRLYEFPYNSWVVTSKLDRVGWPTQYEFTFFKALYLLIGGEDMLASGVRSDGSRTAGSNCDTITDDYCRTESWITLLCLWIGNIFYAILISDVSAVVFNSDHAGRAYQETMAKTSAYMRARKLPPDLCNNIREYYALRFPQQRIWDERSITRNLSLPLQTAIESWNAQHIIETVPLLRASGNTFQSRLAKALRHEAHFDDSTIVAEGDIGTCM